MIDLSTHIFTPQEMNAVDAASVASGIPFFDLMERAGQAVAASALRLYPQARRFVALCGPGNNGGDGYVAARALCEAGAVVAVLEMAGDTALKGDARRAALACPLQPSPLSEYRPEAGDVIIDALFGAGLSRILSGDVQQLIAAINDAGLPVIAVDLPSGICGLRGKVLGSALQATRTITFMAMKLGHLLMPGRTFCGEIEVFDIGIPHRTLAAHVGNIRKNHPSLWASRLPALAGETHKYKRGHLVVFSGSASHTGAARLAATAGSKCGAGLVTVASPQDAVAVNAGALTAVMVRQVETQAELTNWLDTAKISACVLGPGFGVGERARDFVSVLTEKPLVLDADGITSFRDEPKLLFDAFAGGETKLVLTPHEGEFARLFPDIAADENLGKVEKARAAAARSNAVIVYKGADSVIASPDGRAYINSNAPPWLATAGSGDVLAGMIGALLAQGVPAFEAAAAGAYLHGEAALKAEPGMTAEDLAQHANIDLT
ncbi:NAD(P)H-hydrate dehydratase [Rhizobiales bacterium RZME27]|uniref:Bifunctional NAD(P)H-hydrate repair enzyme n=1 Tax=Endobacterium cereale TaxID=2663029 RepID=A0A6A8A475_9HYPH|nr:NAD(P)H-hydrate dehydratase [Endobacterium cereale]MEB2843449.1 NAD(P)H-hydrate dehydratase [Endobacterium cereale]MQY44568.1 NAD(P)H-hydrate dehydratase [Endobacterium cereale]